MIESELQTLIHQFQGFCLTPSLFSSEKFDGLQNFDFPEVEISEEIIAALKALDHPRNNVLGKRMESFFQIAIKFSKRYRLLASNIQIISDKLTLGEIDFLLWDFERKIPLHVELIYKFYCYDPNFDNEIEKWIGPNRKDSLPEKLDKLKLKQLPLLYRKETRKMLSELEIDTKEIQQQVCFKAKLFLPENDSFDSNFINLKSVAGNYYNFEDFIKVSSNYKNFALPRKTSWSLPPEHNLEWKELSEVLILITEQLKQKRSPLVWFKNNDRYQCAFVTWW